MVKTWQTSPAPHSPSGVPWKAYLQECCPHGLAVAIVDGTHVRDYHDSDFSQGGNGHRYDFVPRDEIWVDCQISSAEWPLVVFHECAEVERMRRGQSYSKAHDAAKRLEDQFRRRLRGGHPS
jgi:hypothetical protein